MLSFIKDSRAFALSVLQVLVPLLLYMQFGGVMILGYKSNQNIIVNLILYIYCENSEKCEYSLMKQA